MTDEGSEAGTAAGTGNSTGSGSGAGTAGRGKGAVGSESAAAVPKDAFAIATAISAAAAVTNGTLTGLTKQQQEAIDNNELNILIENLMDLLQDDLVPMSRRAQQQSSAMVVTQAALDGLTHFSGQYIHMMQLMPPAAPDIFNGLCQLFDFYLCSVYNGFVPNEERQRLMSKPTRQTSPSPLQAKDFEVRGLYTYYMLYVICCML
jgi:hypothetical protein